LFRNTYPDIELKFACMEDVVDSIPVWVI